MPCSESDCENRNDEDRSREIKRANEVLARRIGSSLVFLLWRRISTLPGQSQSSVADVIVDERAGAWLMVEQEFSQQRQINALG
jgi:hypothetical protein